MSAPHIRRRVLLGVAAGGLTAVAAACGGGGNGSSSGNNDSTSNSDGTGTQVTAELSDFHIKFSTEEFQAGQYTFTAKNTGSHDHALEIEGPGGEDRSKTIEPGQSTTFTVTLKSGSHEVYCPIDGHKDLGMKTDITVGRAAAPSDNNNTPPDNGY